MSPPPLPSIELLSHAERMVAVFGEVNLYDADLRAIRIGTRSAPVIEVDLALPGDFAQASPEVQQPAEYVITFACLGATTIHADGIHSQNVVGDYGFDSDPASGSRRFWIRGVVGCDLHIHCAEIAVAVVKPVTAAV